MAEACLRVLRLIGGEWADKVRKPLARVTLPAYCRNVHGDVADIATIILCTRPVVSTKVCL